MGDRGPSDRLNVQVARCLMEPSEVRDRLTAGIFLPTEGDEPLARLDDALVKIQAAQPVIDKLRAAMANGGLPKADPEECLEIGVEEQMISNEEAALVLAVIAARKEVIAVDDFAPEWFATERS